MLSYKSTQEEIKEYERQGLSYLPSRGGGDEHPRLVIVSPEVLEIVVPPWPQNHEARRHAALRGLLDGFTEGDRFSVAEDPFNKPPWAMLARVHPVGAEIWDIRSCDPRPGIRAFGRFSATNTFVALTWDYRENLEDKGPDDAYWAAQVNQCQTAWTQFFGALPPHKGNDLNDYLYNFRPV